jgi:hypothetical protein
MSQGLLREGRLAHHAQCMPGQQLEKPGSELGGHQLGGLANFVLAGPVFEFGGVGGALSPLLSHPTPNLAHRLQAGG